MAAQAGPAPWSHEDYWNWRSGHKRITKAQAKKQGVEHTLSSGWRSSQGTIDWEKMPAKYQTKRIKLYNGRTVEVPDADYEDFIGHKLTAEQRAEGPEKHVGEYIDNAFHPDKKYIEQEGKGHILMMEYSPTFQLLRVEFMTNNAIVVYFRVPKEVFSELQHLAVSGATYVGADGDVYHQLGKRFWDIIRIRGQRTGGRYRYEYTETGSYEARGTTRLRAGSEFEKQHTEAKKSLGTAEQKETAKEYLKDFINLLPTSRQAEFMNMYKTASFDKLYKYMIDHGRKGPDGLPAMPSEEELLEDID